MQNQSVTIGCDLLTEPTVWGLPIPGVNFSEQLPPSHADRNFDLTAFDVSERTNRYC
jgi:hypothetical protein